MDIIMYIVLGLIIFYLIPTRVFVSVLVWLQVTKMMLWEYMRQAKERMEAKRAKE